MMIHNSKIAEANNSLLLLAGHISYIFLLLVFNFYATILRKITFLLLEIKTFSGSCINILYPL